MGAAGGNCGDSGSTHRARGRRDDGAASQFRISQRRGGGRGIERGKWGVEDGARDLEILFGELFWVREERAADYSAGAICSRGSAEVFSGGWQAGAVAHDGRRNWNSGRTVRIAVARRGQVDGSRAGDHLARSDGFLGRNWRRAGIEGIQHGTAARGVLAGVQLAPEG